jgi:hypothetical protein
MQVLNASGECKWWISSAEIQSEIEMVGNNDSMFRMERAVTNARVMML